MFKNLINISPLNLDFYSVFLLYALLCKSKGRPRLDPAWSVQKRTAVLHTGRRTVKKVKSPRPGDSHRVDPTGSRHCGKNPNAQCDWRSVPRFNAHTQRTPAGFSGGASQAYAH